MRRLTLLCGLLAVVFLGRSAALAQENPTEPITPTVKIELFNGKDLSGLYTWLSDAKYEDPRQVFTVHDGMIHISGDGLGGVTTKQAYRNYHMICEFKWGTQTWQNRKDWARDSGVLVHIVGPDGALDGIWPESLEAQIVEGGVGDFYVVRTRGPKGLASLTCEVVERPPIVGTPQPMSYTWTKGAPRRTFTGVTDQILWCDHDRNWQNKTGFRGAKDVESPWGQWTRMDVICEADHIQVLVNGKLVNEGFEAHPSAGKLLIQTELAEIFVRRWELWPLGKAPQFDAKALNP